MTCGENKLPPVGLMPFSVGAGGAALVGGADVVVVVVVVEVVDVVGGDFSLLVPQPAVRSPMVTRAAPPPASNRRRVDEFVRMIQQLACRQLSTSKRINFQRNSQSSRRTFQGNEGMIFSR